MNKILLTYCSFVIACLVVIVAFMTATTYTQLTVAILLYPLLVYFTFKVFPRKAMRYTTKKQEATTQLPVESVEKAKEVEREHVGISDIDKRAFLKIIAGAGISLFMFSIFNRKTEGLFSKSLPGSARVSLEDINGKKINPTQSQPMDGFRISEFDDDVITFYGFINKDGAWFIMKGDTDTGSFRYCRGDANFSGSWTNRKNLKYDYFNNIF